MKKAILLTIMLLLLAGTASALYMAPRTITVQATTVNASTKIASSAPATTNTTTTTTSSSVVAPKVLSSPSGVVAPATKHASELNTPDTLNEPANFTVSPLKGKDSSDKEHQTWTVADAKGMLSDAATDKDLAADGWSGCRADEEEKCTNHYDKNGLLVGYTENITDDSAPGKTTTTTHLYKYNKLGQVEKEITVDHETGEISDVEALMDAMEGLDEMSEIFQLMQSLLDLSAEQKKQSMNEATAAGAQKLAEARNATAEKEKEINKEKKEAGKKYDQGILSRMTSFFGWKKKYYDKDHSMIAYTKGQEAHFFVNNTEIIYNREKGEITGSGDIDELMQIVMFELMQSQDEDLRELVTEMQQSNEQKSTQREYAEYMKEQKAVAKEKTDEGYEEQKAKEWYTEEGQPLADKLPGTSGEWAKKGVEFGEGNLTEPQGKINNAIDKEVSRGKGFVDNRSFFGRLWDRMFGSDESMRDQEMDDSTQERQKEIQTLSNIMKKKNQTEDILTQNIK